MITSDDFHFIALENIWYIYCHMLDKILDYY